GRITGTQMGRVAPGAIRFYCSKRSFNERLYIPVTAFRIKNNSLSWLAAANDPFGDVHFCSAARVRKRNSGEFNLWSGADPRGTGAPDQNTHQYENGCSH